MIDASSAQEIDNANPLAATADEMYSAAMESENGYGEMFKFHRDIRNMPYKVNADRLREGLEKTIWSCLGQSPQVMNEKAALALWEKAREQNHAADLLRAEMKNLKIAAAGHVGTHTGKVPNPNVGGPVALIADRDVMAAAAKLPFLSSSTLKPGLKFGAAGNAAQGRAQRLLCMVFDVEGKVVSLLEDLASRGQFYEALVSIAGDSTDVDEISDILAGRLATSINEEPGEYAKALIWPTEEGDVVITPVHPYAMHDAFQKRHRERVAGGSGLRYVSVKVGGTKPQNAGLVNNDHGGWHRHLVSVPPSTRTWAERAFYRAYFAKELAFASVGKSHPAWLKFHRVVKNLDWDNDAGRKALGHSLRKLVDISIRPYVALKAAVEDQDDVAISALESLSVTEQAIVGGQLNKVERANLDHFIDRVVFHIAGLAGKHGVVFDDALNRVARIAVKDRLLKFF